MMLHAPLEQRYRLKALQFASASSQYVTMGNNYDFERTDKWTVSFWIKFTASSFAIVAGKIDTLTHSGSADLGWYVQTNGGKSAMLLTDGFAPGANWIACETADTYNDGAWHHICWAYDGSSTQAGFTCFADGASASVNDAGFTISSSIKNAASFELSGRVKFGGGREDLYDGKLSDVAIYDTNVSTTDLANIYNDHCPPDLTVKGPTAHLVGFWRPRLTEVYPTVVDLSSSGHDGTMTNMSASDIIQR